MSRFAFGILGGDLNDEWLPEDTIIVLTGCDPDDLLDEIGPGEDDPVALWQKSRARELQDWASLMWIAGLQEILGQAHKPIFFVPGNHHRIDWPDNGQMKNLHLKRMDYLDWNLVGYRWTLLDQSDGELRADLNVLNDLVDERTILISHSPARGTLDGLSGWGTGYGMDILNQIKATPCLHLVGHVHSLAGQSGHTINGCWPETRISFEIDLKSRAALFPKDSLELLMRRGK